MDPRPSVIVRRLAGIRRILAVSGGKGGIGKSSVASVLALILSRKGYRVGLLDLDLAGPSTHMILGVPATPPIEDKGLIPPEFAGLRFMSVIYFTGDHPTAFRGSDISNAVTEILAITLWNALDFLIMDMPPGLGDTTLDVIRLVRRMEYLIVTVPSAIAAQVAKKELSLLRQLHVPVVGFIENMSRNIRVRSPFSPDLECIGPYLGVIPYDTTLEVALGDADRLIETDFSRHLERAVPAIEASNCLSSLRL